MNVSPRIAVAVVSALLLVLAPVGIGRILQQPDALVYIQNMEGISDHAEVVWKGRKVGSISGRTMDRGVHRLELTLAPAVFKTVRSDAEVHIDRSNGLLVLVGGDRKSEPFLQKGAELALERGRVFKSVAVARRGFEEAVENMFGFWEGLCGPVKKCPGLGPDDAQSRVVKRGKTDDQAVDFFVVGPLDGIEVGTRVEWKGARIGKVSQVGYYDRREKAGVVLESGYFGKLRTDARVQIVQSEPPFIRVIGGDDASHKVIETGGHMPLQSIADEGKLAGANLRALFHDFASEFQDLWRTITDKKFLREIEEHDTIASNDSFRGAY